MIRLFCALLTDVGVHIRLGRVVISLCVIRVRRMMRGYISSVLFEVPLNSM